jgi:hypothetical protein
MDDLIITILLVFICVINEIIDVILYYNICKTPTDFYIIIRQFSMGNK